MIQPPEGDWFDSIKRCVSYLDQIGVLDFEPLLLDPSFVDQPEMTAGDLRRLVAEVERLRKENAELQELTKDHRDFARSLERMLSLLDSSHD